MLDKQILKYIGKIKRRLVANLTLNTIVIGIIVTFIIGGIITFISIFLPIYKAFMISIGVVIIGVITSCIYSVFKVPNSKKAALIMDSKGLKERLTTSLELIGNDEPMSLMQKRDTIDVINTISIKKSIPIRVSLKSILIMLLSLIVFLTCGFMPSPAKDKAIEQHKLEQVKKDKIDKINQAEKKIEKVEKLSELDKSQMKQVLEQSLKELKKAETEEQIEKALERLDKKMEKEINKQPDKNVKEQLQQMMKEITPNKKEEIEKKAKDDLNRLTKEFLNEKVLQDIAKALENANLDELKSSFMELNSKLAELSEAEKSQLSSALQNLAESLSDEQLKEILEKLSKDVKLGEVNEELIKEAIKALEELGEAAQMSLSQNSGNPQGTGQNAGQGSNQGQGAGQGQGQGQGSGSGQGTGSGQGNTGNGAGPGWNYGSKDGINKPGSGGNTGEKIVIPGREQGNDGNLTGQHSGDGNSQITNSQDSLSWRGQEVHYNQVIGEYTNKAMEHIQSNSVPDPVKGIIKEYFESLNK